MFCVGLHEEHRFVFHAVMYDVRACKRELAMLKCHYDQIFEFHLFLHFRVQ